jgi:branched-chain amino acid transport system substrate-binding protein
VAAWNGAQVAQKQINDAGGVLGCQVVLDKVDDVGDPIDAVTNVKADLGINNPPGLVGESSLTAYAVQPIADRNQIPNFQEAGSPYFDQNKDPWLWRLTPSDSQLAIAMAISAYDLKYKNGAILFQSGDPDNVLGPLIQKTFTCLGGTVPTIVYLTNNESSYRSEILKVLGVKPDVIFLDAPPGSAATIMSNFRELNNLTVPFIGTDLTAGSDWINAVTPATAHDHVTSLAGGSDETAPAVAAFNAGYQALFNSKPLAGANYEYDGVVLLSLAIQQAGTTDGSTVNAAVTKVSNPPGTKVSTYTEGLKELKAGGKVNYDGASGPMDYNQYHNVFGPFNVFKADASGSPTIMSNISADRMLQVANQCHV